GAGAGAARTVVAARTGRRVRSGLGALVRLLPDRPRSLVIGVAGSVAVLLATGAVLVGASLAVHAGEAGRQFDLLAPGIVGGALLVLVQLAFLPNAAIWGMSYAIGPGFAVGSGTSVAATGVLLDVVPVFPPLAALPQPGPAPVVSLVALAAPFLAGAVGGVLTVRAMPSTVSESAPLWGFASGALTGVVTAVLAALSGGPLGGARMATVGPSWWQVGLFAALEVGISAAIAAWLANWRILRGADGLDPVPAGPVPAGPVPAGPVLKENRRERRRREAPVAATAALPAPSAS
ncbi:cell division protein PerM, partial [Actinomadura harenae]